MVEVKLSKLPCMYMYMHVFAFIDFLFPELNKHHEWYPVMQYL